MSGARRVALTCHVSHGRVTRGAHVSHGGRHVAQVMDYSLLVGVVKDPAARVREYG